MKTKPNIKKLMNSIKATAKPVSNNLADALTKALVHPQFRERDMRQEAMDMGSHGAQELWGEKDAGTI